MHSRLVGVSHLVIHAQISAIRTEDSLYVLKKNDTKINPRYNRLALNSDAERAVGKVYTFFAEIARFRFKNATSMFIIRNRLLLTAYCLIRIH